MAAEIEGTGTSSELKSNTKNMKSLLGGKFFSSLFIFFSGIFTSFGSAIEHEGEEII